eukprot:g7385.t1
MLQKEAAVAPGCSNLQLCSTECPLGEAYVKYQQAKALVQLRAQKLWGRGVSVFEQSYGSNGIRYTLHNKIKEDLTSPARRAEATSCGDFLLRLSFAYLFANASAMRTRYEDLRASLRAQGQGFAFPLDEGHATFAHAESEIVAEVIRHAADDMGEKLSKLFTNPSSQRQCVQSMESTREAMVQSRKEASFTVPFRANTEWQVGGRPPCCLPAINLIDFELTYIDPRVTLWAGRSRA